MANKSNVVRTVNALRKRVAEWRQAGESVALVPTMGALHEGHLSLVKLARKKADRVIVSIFVNPTQFGANEDLSKYPRDEKRDREQLDELDTDLIFIPNVDQIYPEGFSTSINLTGVTEGLCGGSRPTHFSGVATIVTKLLLQSLPDIAIFGEKDYQQLQVIKRLAIDLNIPVKIEGGAIVREKDGLALSSRNVYLTPQEREIAPNLHDVMKQVSVRLKAGGPVSQTLTNAKKRLTKLGFKVDYLELRDAKSLTSIGKSFDKPARLFGAVFLGKTRLIDNLKVMAPK